ncbi:MAG TPA: secretin N-terminal domain-containing protein [Thermoanaerobaculia bacterium]|nr:secretin N-terminal domain-containing protein [Thermoanaerobaculia bacterium]
MKRLIAALLVCLSLASCTSYRAFQQAKEQETLQNWDNAVVAYSKALEIDPNNLRYRISLQRAKLEASRVHFDKGKSLRASAEDKSTPVVSRLQLLQLAAIEFELTIKLDPTNQFAAVQLAKSVAEIRELSSAASSGTLDAMKKRAVTKAQPPDLNPSSNEPISLVFPKPTAVKDIYRSLGNAFGINVVFDQSVKDDERITIELRDVTAQQALERVMQASNHFYKVLDEKTIIVVPNNPQMRREYEDLVIRTFYLSNGDAEQVTNVVRTMIEARNVFPLKALNAITIRDTADRVRIAEKIIEANDKAKSEVVVDVELLQMDVTRGREIGLQLVNAGSVSPFTPLQSLVDAEGAPVTSLRIDQFRDLGPFSWTLNVPSILYGFLKTSTDAQLLAKPQLRISEGEKASLHIGQRIPVPVSTFTSASPGTGNTFAPVTSFQYQDVGIKISIEPRVHHNREVTLKLTVEVSNLAGFATGTSPPQPIIGTRTIESTIRLKDGETNFLAGLIRKDESVSDNGIPFISDLPVLGKLFSRERKDSANTDLVLTMTPHVIRIPDITEDDLSPLWVGTQNNMTFRGVSPRLESATGVDPFNNFPNPAVAPPPAEGEEEEMEAGEQPPPAPVNIPGVAPMGGSAPTDPFRQAPPPPPPSGNRRPQTQEQNYMISFSPRIAPQPTSVILRPGEERSWTIVGMDLDGLRTETISLRYDPRSVMIETASVGVAMKVDPLAPPVIRVDSAAGRVVVTSSDGNPLEFLSGGEVISLRVRGTGTGQSLLVVEPIAFINRSGAAIEAAIAGGRVEVQ